MKWQFLLLANSLFFEPALSSDRASFLSSNAKFFGKLAKYNVKLKPLAKSSANFVTDYPKKKSRQQLLRTTKQNEIDEFKSNDEAFCYLVVATNDATKVPLSILLATKELINWKHNYDRGKFSYSSQANSILIGLPTRFYSGEEQMYVLLHEFIHAVMANHYAAHPRNETKSNLTTQEKLFAPYTDQNKATFLQTIEIGVNRTANLTKIMSARTTPLGRFNRYSHSTKKIIDCLEEEARSHNTTVAQILHKVTNEITIIKKQYEPNTQAYELLASILAVLNKYPKLLDYLFPELHAFFLDQVPELKQCLNTVAPKRLTLTCK